MKRCLRIFAFIHELVWDIVERVDDEKEARCLGVFEEFEEDVVHMVGEGETKATRGG